MVDRYGPTQADETGNADHGSSLEPGRAVHSRDSGSISGEGQTGLFHRADHGLPPGREKDIKALQEDQQRPYFRGHYLSPSGPGQIDRRPVEPVWRPDAELLRRLARKDKSQ